MIRKATWVNGKRKVTGVWWYNPASNRFTIELDEKHRDHITGELRKFTVYGEYPEWGNWKCQPCPTDSTPEGDSE